MRSVICLATALLLSSVSLANATSVELTDKLLASDEAAGDVFGVSVGLSGSTPIVAAFLDDHAGNSSGYAYFYTANALAPVPLLASLWLLCAAVGGAAGLRVWPNGGAILEPDRRLGCNPRSNAAAYILSVFVCCC